MWHCCCCCRSSDRCVLLLLPRPGHEPPDAAVKQMSNVLLDCGCLLLLLGLLQLLACSTSLLVTSGDSNKQLRSNKSNGSTPLHGSVSTESPES
jgi:hypothetical protein